MSENCQKYVPLRHLITIILSLALAFSAIGKFALSSTALTLDTKIEAIKEFFGEDLREIKTRLGRIEGYLKK